LLFIDYDVELSDLVEVAKKKLVDDLGCSDTDVVLVFVGE
jgi:hypothetical protein